MAGRYPRYVSKSERDQKREESIKKISKKREINPVVIEGRIIAKTWWGKSWNLNLERYSDYSSRVGRGKTYVRQGAVIDLQITKNKIDALVQGSRKKPYEIEINIATLEKNKWEKIKKDCEGEIDTLNQLIEGDFSNELAQKLFTKDEGLFPSPDEIEFECSCPDWAYMCKHVAATLYAIGKRLDEEPTLLFLLRDVEFNELIKDAAISRKDKILKKAENKSSRVIDDEDVSDMFDIDI